MAETGDILDVLRDHLGQGRLDAGAMERLDRLKGMIPAGAGGAGGELWRATTLPAASVAALRAGETVELEPRPFECWSRSRLGVRHLLRLRAGQAGAPDAAGRPDMAVLLRREVPEDRCLLDVEAYFRATGADRDGGVSWVDYAGREGEVILEVPGGRVRIVPEDLAETWRTDDPSLWDPEVGETFWDGNDDIRIEELLGCNDCGCFEVRAGARIYPLFPESFGLTVGGEPRDIEDMPSPA